MDRRNLFLAAGECLGCVDVDEKLALTDATAARFAAGDLEPLRSGAAAPVAAPGRPARPQLVGPRDLPRRGLGTQEGRAALVHAVAHIEFNAVNLAWDAVQRFRDMPDEYYRDWIGVAVDEARHFRLLRARLADLGHAYGDFDAHDGLWEMAIKTSSSCMERMALVPRVLEARGLDVTPAMIARLRQVGDDRTVAILEVILHEEVAHVAAGSRWFSWCCERAGADPAVLFARLVERHAKGAVRPPFNEPARLAAGFTAQELACLRSGFAA